MSEQLSRQMDLLNDSKIFIGEAEQDFEAEKKRREKEDQISAEAMRIIMSKSGKYQQVNLNSNGVPVKSGKHQQENFYDKGLPVKVSSELRQNYNNALKKYYKASSAQKAVDLVSGGVDLATRETDEIKIRRKGGYQYTYLSAEITATGDVMPCLRVWDAEVVVRAELGGREQTCMHVFPQKNYNGSKDRRYSKILSSDELDMCSDILTELDERLPAAVEGNPEATVQPIEIHRPGKFLIDSFVAWQGRDGWGSY